MSTDAERLADPYFIGAQVPAPSVMSINGTVASLAVTMFMAVLTGFPSNPRHLLYNVVAGSLRSVTARADAECFVCSPSGAFGRGDSWPLFARKE
jgi:hypothetical protein